MLVKLWDKVATLQAKFRSPYDARQKARFAKYFGLLDAVRPKHYIYERYRRFIESKIEKFEEISNAEVVVKFHLELQICDYL